MKISVEWLKDYVEIKESVDELSEALTMAGLEVEGVEEAGDDTVLEIGVTPNRPDWLSHIGVAREIAAIFGRDLSLPDTQPVETGPPVESMTTIDIEDPQGCPRYCGRVLTGIKIGPAPDWVRTRLEAVGVRSISNVVDATNYVMLEMGQPLHAFDYHRLAENRIVVRMAKKGEKLTTLDDEERTLEESDLLICDGLGPVALAGVMGGANSEVSENTQDLLLESACFDPSTIRRTSKRMGLSTEASYRFERGSDPSGAARAIDRLARLVNEWSGGEVCQGVCDIHPRSEEERKVVYRPSRVAGYLGVDVDAARCAHILTSLELSPQEAAEDKWEVTVPGFRRDLFREEDVIEEVARIFGYQNVPVTMPVGTTVPVTAQVIETMQNRARDLMEGMGFTETVTYSFIAQPEIDELGISGGQDPVRVLNPISEEMEVMRTSILPGLLKAARINASRRLEDLSLYEIGRVFLPCTECDLPEERVRVAGIMAGRRSRKSWYGPEAEAGFFDMKGVVSDLLQGMGVKELTFADMEVPYLQPGQSAWVSAGEIPLGAVGTILPELRDKYRLRSWAGCFELDLNHLERVDRTKKYSPVPQYPGLLRDVALVVPSEVSSEKLENAVMEAAEELSSVKLFDLYEGKGIPEGSRSLAYALTFQSDERTLTDAEVDASMAKILSALKEKFGAELR
jgi:phenylalanyl-tRNA synthetase beta chain